jgi:hypothetical protein
LTKEGGRTNALATVRILNMYKIERPKKKKKKKKTKTKKIKMKKNK